VSTPAVVIAGCTVVTFAIKAAGPVLSGGRELPLPVRDVLVLFAPALLAALVVVSALANEKTITVDSETAGVAVAGLVYWRSRSVVWCVLVAAGVTAGLRAIT
jgi:branched-subunit amino acid transport protein